MSVLIKNGLIISQDEKRNVFSGNIFIEDSYIVEISKKNIDVESDVVIDASNKLVMPGLINTHTHVPMILFRGFGDDMVLQEWLEQRIWPVEAKLTKEIIGVAAKLAFLEMIASGTTTFQDMYFFEDTIAEIAEQIGLRAVLGFALIDYGTPEYTADQLLPACTKFLNRYKKNTLITPVIAPHGTYTCGPETLSEVKQLSERYDVGIHTHCAETRDEVYTVKETYGKRPVDQLNTFDLLNERMVLAHCGWITKTEVKQISNNGSAVSHCPVSNMKIGTGGFTPVPELLNEHVAVGLGTDGAASNNSLDMFDTMKFCALVHKQHRWDPKVLAAQTVLDLATITGAQSLRMQQNIGSIEEGKKADIILIDLNKPHLTPCHDPVSHLIYTAKGADVCTTIVNGKVLYVDYQFRLCDEQSIMQDADQAAKDLISRL